MSGVRDATAPGSVRVATWNVRTGLGADGWRSWPFRRGSAAATVRALAADVIGLQEVHAWQLPPLRRAVPRHVAVGDGRGRRRGGERCTLLVGPALRIVHHRTLWFSGSPTVPGTRLPGATHPRVVTLAELEGRGTGERFGVAVAHLDHRLEDNRTASASMLLGWMDPTIPWVLLGDLNAGPDSPTLRRLEGAGFRSALPPEAGGTAHQFTGTLDGPRIDHVLVRGAWVVGGARILHVRPGGRPASDHWPVVADLRRV